MGFVPGRQIFLHTMHLLDRMSHSQTNLLGQVKTLYRADWAVTYAKASLQPVRIIQTGNSQANQ